MSRVLRSLSAVLIVGLQACASRPPPPLPPPPASQVDKSAEPPPITPQWFGASGKSEPKVGAGGKASERARARARVVPVLAKNRARPNERSSIGTDLLPIGPGTDWVFIDLMKQASPWVSYELRGGKKAKDARKIELDEQGWVEQLMSDQNALTKFPTQAGGAYLVLYEGRGKIDFENATVEDDQPGRILIRTKRDTIATLILASTNPSDHVHNIRIVPPAFEEPSDSVVFQPTFLGRVSKMAVLRMSGWGRSSDSNLVHWADRPRLDDASQAGPHGVAYEYMIMLANEVQADLWITIPAQADDAHVQKLAELVRDNLDPGRRLYLEYGHELWSAPEYSPAAAYAARQAAMLALDPDPALARAHFVARRSAQVFEIAQKVMDEGSMVRVIAGHLGAPAELEAVLAREQVYKVADVLAVAPYFGSELGKLGFVDTVEQNNMVWLFDQLANDSLPEVLNAVKEAKKVAKRYEMPLISYGGGQALLADIEVRSRETINDRFDTANRNPRMKALYLALLEGWQKSGGELFVHPALSGSFSKHGRLGASEATDQPLESAPKLAALYERIEAAPRWWQDVHSAAIAVAPPPPPPGVKPPPPPPPPPPGGVLPPSGGVGTMVEPPSQMPEWISGGVGVVGLALGWVFTGLSLDAGHQRDRLLVKEYFPADGAPAHAEDDRAFSNSLIGSAGFLLAAGGFTAGLVLHLLEDGPEPGTVESQSDAPSPAVWSAIGSAAVSAGAGVAFLIASQSSASARDDLLTAEPNPSYSAPIRELDDEAFRFSLVALAGFGVAGASAGLAFLFHWLELQPGFLGAEGTAGLHVTANGVEARW